jgi:hypothetical protein
MELNKKPSITPKDAMLGFFASVNDIFAGQLIAIRDVISDNLKRPE